MSDDPNLQPGSLDQPEVAAPLAPEAGVEQLTQIVILADGTRAESALKVEPYDFRNPVFLSEVELRRLRMVHEDFVRYLSARLSLFLRMEFGVKMTKLTTIAYSKFTESLPSPTHVCLFKAEPLVGVGVLEINPRLALTIADRLLGGRGNSVKAERSLTEIEIGLLEDIMLIVLEEWCSQWKQEQELSPLLIGHENSGRFLQTSPRDAIILALTMEVNFGDCTEQMQIGVPYYTIEPLARKMQARRQKDSAVAADTRKSASWHPSYDRISLPVRAEWNALDLTLRELSCIRVGDVIELPAGLITDTRVLLNGTQKFIGTAGLDGDRVAVELNRKLPSQEAPLNGNQNGN
jgi:flagellar motor switch protein FliM